MKNIMLTARKLDNSSIGNQYMLAIAQTGGLGLSNTPASDHAYRTVDQLIEAIEKCGAFDLGEQTKLKILLNEGTPYMTNITVEHARCMGFIV